MHATLKEAALRLMRRRTGAAQSNGSRGVSGSARWHNSANALITSSISPNPWRMSKRTASARQPLARGESDGMGKDALSARHMEHLTFGGIAAGNPPETYLYYPKSDNSVSNRAKVGKFTREARAPRTRER
jgi:hypothetical protein